MEIHLFGRAIVRETPLLGPSSGLMGAHQEEEAGADKHTAHIAKPSEKVPCPRCNSLDTKFCYFNNYNVKQPRHFCRSCLRYWTAGGSLRNVPVGSGRRRNRAFSPTEASPTENHPVADVYGMPAHRSSFKPPIPADGSIPIVPICKPTTSFPCFPQTEAPARHSNEALASFPMAEGSSSLDRKVVQHNGVTPLDPRIPTKSSAHLSHVHPTPSLQVPTKGPAEPGHGGAVHQGSSPQILRSSAEPGQGGAVRENSSTQMPTEKGSAEPSDGGPADHGSLTQQAAEASKETIREEKKEEEKEEAVKVPPVPLVPVSFGSPQTMAVPWLWPWPCFSWPANYMNCPTSSSSSSPSSCTSTISSLTFSQPQPPPPAPSSSSSSASPAPLVPTMFAAPISSLMPTMFAHPMASSSSPSPPLLPTIFPAAPMWSPFLLGKRPSESEPIPQEHQPPAGTPSKMIRVDGLHPQAISSPSSSSSTTTFHEHLTQAEAPLPAPKPSQELVEGHIKAEPSAVS